MIYDKQLMFSEAQAVFASGASVLSTNTIDLLRAGQDIGVGEEMDIHITVTIAFAGGTSVAFNLVHDTVPGLGSATTLYVLGTFLTASLPLGAELTFHYPPDTPTTLAIKRYIGLQYTNVGVMTAGSVTAGILKNAQRWKSYPSNFVSA